MCPLLNRTWRRQVVCTDRAPRALYSIPFNCPRQVPPPCQDSTLGGDGSNGDLVVVVMMVYVHQHLMCVFVCICGFPFEERTPALPGRTCPARWRCSTCILLFVFGMLLTEGPFGRRGECQRCRRTPATWPRRVIFSGA
ncbi:unnamed protein product [Prorocentrum cordatum]|uniref:Uncharacterized protein n=1 Tax=Prorocentrum cordatum TaxID=2364126 RepID=A0ABN9SW74_9DINO|nr:unnamed protein product [Polarella glacialis]